MYELLGRTGVEIPNLAQAQRYEAAFDAYLARDFAGAAELLTASKGEDPPSAVLHARCQELRGCAPAARLGRGTRCRVEVSEIPEIPSLRWPVADPARSVRHDSKCGSRDNPATSS